MGKQPNLYKQFLKDIHPELLDQFNRFIKESDVYKQFIKFAHPEFESDFKKYTDINGLYVVITPISDFWKSQINTIQSLFGDYIEKYGKRVRYVIKR